MRSAGQGVSRHKLELGGQAGDELETDREKGGKWQEKGGRWCAEGSSKEGQGGSCVQ